MEKRQRRQSTWLILSAAAIVLVAFGGWRLHQIAERLKLSTPLVEAAGVGQLWVCAASFGAGSRSERRYHDRTKPCGADTRNAASADKSC